MAGRSVELHEQAMQLADQHRYLEAADLEQAALLHIPNDRIRTRAVIARSLSYLLFKAYKRGR